MNLVSPMPVTNLEFTRALGAALHRPAVFPVPGWLLRLLGGQFDDETVLSSLRVVPAKLLDAGFRFQQRTLPEALAACGLK